MFKRSPKHEHVRLEGQNEPLWLVTLSCAESHGRANSEDGDRCDWVMIKRTSSHWLACVQTVPAADVSCIFVHRKRQKWVRLIAFKSENLDHIQAWQRIQTLTLQSQCAPRLALVWSTASGRTVPRVSASRPPLPPHATSAAVEPTTALYWVWRGQALDRQLPVLHRPPRRSPSSNLDCQCRMSASWTALTPVRPLLPLASQAES